MKFNKKSKHCCSYWPNSKTLMNKKTFTTVLLNNTHLFYDWHFVKYLWNSNKRVYKSQKSITIYSLLLVELDKNNLARLLRFKFSFLFMAKF